MEKTFKNYFTIFITFFKIGLFTFGGGYAMLALIQREFVNVKKWIKEDELLDIFAISESTPGPIAINTATYVGYKVLGFFGALLATLGVCIPSFVIIFCISLFLNQFLEIQIVAAAFKGIQCGIAVLILFAGIKMFKQIKGSIWQVVVFVIAFVLMFLITLFSWNFSSIYLIIIGAVLGLFINCIIEYRKKKMGGKK